MRGPVLPAPVGAPVRCVCGCSRELHDHYRPGSDCGRCGASTCPGWRPPGGRLARAVRSLAARL